MKISQSVDKNLWLVHLVQLKKLFLKLSAYVELYLKQDWSLLPVPDFKLVARSDEETSHLNFMVSAVLLTATHSGKNLEFEKILEFVIPTGLRKDIQLIQDAFMMALEPKSPKKLGTNSPRRTSLTPTLITAFNTAGITPKVLFPSNLAVETTTIESIDIKLQEIQENYTEVSEDYVSKQEEVTISYSVIQNDNLVVQSDESAVDENYINLQNEVKLLEIKLAEMEKILQKQQETEASHIKTIYETIEEMRNLKERQEYEKLERNSLIAFFEEEKQILTDQIELLRSENDEKLQKFEILKRENQEMQEAKEDTTKMESLVNELNESKLDNSKLVRGLKKARDHILKQDSMIKELKNALDTMEKSRNEEIESLKESFELERSEMNRVLIDLGTSIQKTNLQ